MTTLAESGAWMHLPGEEGNPDARAHFFPARGAVSLCLRWTHGQGLGDWDGLTAWPHHPATPRRPEECGECDLDLWAAFVAQTPPPGPDHCGDGICEEPHP